MKKIFVLFVMLPTLLFATPIDPSTALQVAENFINAPQIEANGQIRKVKSPKKMVRMTRTISDNQQFYIYQGQDGQGFVIVSADDVAQPILGYSKTGYIDMENIPDNMKGWLDIYTDEISWAIEYNVQPTKEVKESWKKLLNNEYNEATPIVEPLIKTKWNQNTPYNDLCPVWNGKDRAATGCVATAAAQIMKYWNYPTKGTGSHTYTTATRKITLSANFANTTFDWANMLNSYSGNPNTTQRNAIATLMYNIGVAFDMDYAATDDGTSNSNIAYLTNGLQTYLGYNSYAIPVFKNNQSSLAGWIMVLKKQLDAGLPLLYGGGEHCFICDGYNSEYMFHFNWGWGGSSADGWYSILSLKPKVTGIGAGQGDYTLGQCAIINIKPDNGEQKNFDLQTYLFSYVRDTISRGDTIQYEFEILNNGDSTFTGDICVGLADSTSIIPIKEYQNVTIEPGHLVRHLVEDLNFTNVPFLYKSESYGNTAVLSEGLYGISILYKAHSASTYENFVGSDCCSLMHYIYIYDAFVLTPGKYVIVANRNVRKDNWFYMTSGLGTASTKRLQAVNSGVQAIDDVEFTNLPDSMVWELVKDGSNWKLKNGAKYLSWTSGNSATLDATGKSLTFEIGENRVNAHFNDGTDERYLSLNGTAGNDYLAFYKESVTTSIKNLYFLPYEEKPLDDNKYFLLTKRKTGNYYFLTPTPVTNKDRLVAIDAGDSVRSRIDTANTSSSYLWTLEQTPSGIKLKSSTDEYLYSSAAKSAKLDATGLALQQRSNADGTSTFYYPNSSTENWYLSLATTGNDYFVFYTNEYQFTHFLLMKPGKGSPTPTSTIMDNSIERPKVQKILRDGQLYILRDGKTYNAQGGEVR